MLCVWLPLNGDLHNQGTLNITGTNYNSTVNTAGKIGSCYYFNGSNMRIEYPHDKTIWNDKEISICMWYKWTTGNEGTVTVVDIAADLCLQYTHSSSGLRFGFWRCYSNNGTRAGSSDIIATYYSDTEWHHVVLTCSGGINKIYVDGTLVQSFDKSSNYTANWTPLLGASYNKITIGKSAGSSPYASGYVNDVRIYDHALSAAEVKEISQGLVLHYKLDSFQQGGNPNLLARYVVPGQAGPTSTANGGRTIWAGDYKIIIPASENADTYFRLFMTEQLTANTVYTISCEVSGLLTGSQYNFPLFAQGNTSMGILTLNHNGLCSLTFTMTWTGTQTAVTGADGETVYVNFLDDASRSLASGQGPITLSNFKLEKGTSVTAWCPSGINDNIIEDSGGYNHNGTILNTVSISSDTPRYYYSTKLEAANSMINCGRGGMVTDSITVNFWLKSSSWGNPVSCTEGGGWNFEGDGDYFRFPIYISGVGYKYGKSTHTRAQICNNQWHMLTGIYDRINQKVQIYVDGYLDNDYAAGTSNNIGYNGSNVIWIGAEATGSNTTASNGMVGLFSDFRIYSTALSAADVLELYHTGAKIDNKGGTHAYEFIEHQDNILFPAELSRTKLEFTNGLSRYTQSNCQVNLVEDGYHIYRPPNLTQSANGNTMWGGLQLVNQSVNTIAAYDAARDNWWHLQQNHTYIAAFHAHGKSSNATTWSWTNNMGWGGGGVQPSPTTIVNEGIPADFNGEKDCFYIFTITDAISKPCTSAYSSYVAGTTYLSYRHLTFGWGYTSTGTLGTDLYLTNFRLYDITSNMAQFTKQGQANFYDIVEQMDKCQIRKNSELLSSEIIEL